MNRPASERSRRSWGSWLTRRHWHDLLDPRVYTLDHRGNRVAIDPTGDARSVPDRSPSPSSTGDVEGPPAPARRMSIGRFIRVSIIVGFAVLYIIWAFYSFVSAARWVGRTLSIHPALGGVVMVASLAIVSRVSWLIGTGKAKRARAIPGTIENSLRDNACPGCGHPLEGIPEEDDGCTVCGECGGAWNVAGLLAEYPFMNPPLDSDAEPKAPARPKIIDVRGWHYPFMLRLSRRQVRARVREGRRSQPGFLRSYFGIVGIALPLGVFVLGAYQRMPLDGAVVLAALVAVAVNGATLMLHVHNNRRRVVKAMSNAAVLSGVCPCCGEALPGEPSRFLEARICPGCGGAWDPSGSVGHADDWRWA